MNVECCFGLLVARWGILWRPLRSTLVHNILVIQVCAVMHNWCQRRGIEHPIAPPAGLSSVPLAQRPFMNHQGVPLMNLAGSSAQPLDVMSPTMAALRCTLVAEMAAAGLKRPSTRIFAIV